MKKTFELTNSKIKIARMFDAAKHETKKYLKRERNKPLAEGSDFWDFDCKFGATEEEAVEIHVTEINKKIDEMEKLEQTSFYIEILAKPGIRKSSVEDNELDE